MFSEAVHKENLDFDQKLSPKKMSQSEKKQICRYSFAVFQALEA